MHILRNIKAPCSLNRRVQADITLSDKLSMIEQLGISQTPEPATIANSVKHRSLQLYALAHVNIFSLKYN